MTNHFVFETAEHGRRDPVNYLKLELDLRMIDPHCSLLNMLMERISNIDGKRNQICILFLLLKRYFKTSFFRHHNVGFYTFIYGLVSHFNFYTTQLKAKFMNNDVKTATENGKIVECNKCGESVCRCDCPFRSELIRQEKMSSDDIGCNCVVRDVLNTPLDDWLDNSDVMRVLNVSLRTLQTLRSNGKILYTRLGRKILYRKEDIQRMLAEKYTMFEIHNEYGKKRKKMTA